MCGVGAKVALRFGVCLSGSSNVKFFTSQIFFVILILIDFDFDLIELVFLFGFNIILWSFFADQKHAVQICSNTNRMNRDCKI